VLSPDGTKIAYISYDAFQNQTIIVINADGTGKKIITTDNLKKWGLAWGSDKLAYVSFGKDGLEKIFVINPMAPITTSLYSIIPDRAMLRKINLRHGLRHPGARMGRPCFILHLTIS